MKMRRLISAIIALLLVVNLSVTAFAAEWYLEDGDITVSAGDGGQTVSQGGGAAIPDSAPVITGTSKENNVTINADSGQTASVTLSGVNIDVRDKGKAAVSTTGEGNVSIELNGGSTLRSGYEHAGLEKNNGGSLTIADEDKNGKLTAWGEQQGAGIGGGSGKDGSNIFITGEPGTGRTKMAQSIQRVQPRGGPFVRADCSAIDPALLDAELFGREGGQPGLFREADGGTLLLDEVGEMPLSVQAKLLNAIRRGEVLPVGAARPVTVDVRLLAIAGPNLRDEVETGRFRQDLYYRLSAFSVEMPPLRDCREDIYLMANELMEQICQRYGMPEKSLSGEAFSKLINYDWPGNLRELENVLEGAAALSDSDIIYPEHIRLETEPAVQTLRQHLRQEERRYIQQTLAQCGGDRQQAMKLLDVSRSVFYERLKEYGLH